MLKTNEQLAKITSVNVRAEKHGDKPVPAADIGIYFEASAKKLDDFEKGLRDAFYTAEPPKGAQQSLPGTTEGPTFLRFNGTLGALKIKKEIPGYVVGIICGEIAGSVDMEFDSVKVCKVGAELKEGGTVGVSLQLQAHPDEAEYGKLAMLIDREIRLTLDPPTAADLKKLEKEAADAKKKAEDDDPE